MEWGLKKEAWFIKGKRSFLGNEKSSGDRSGYLGTTSAFVKEKMFRQTLVALLLLVAVNAFGGGMEKLMKTYGHTKIMESCIGKEYMMKWKKRLAEACDKCSGMQTVSQESTSTVSEYLDNINQKYFGAFQGQPLQIGYLPFNPLPMNNLHRQPGLYIHPFFLKQRLMQEHPHIGPQSPHFPNAFRPQMPIMMGPHQPNFMPFPSHHISKRSIVLTEKTMEKMKAKMTEKLSNLTCALKEMNYVTPEDNPNYSFMESEILLFNVSESLKEGFLKALDFCKSFAECLPIEKLDNPLEKRFGRLMMFLKCFSMKEIKVCMKEDIRTFTEYLDVANMEQNVQFASLPPGANQRILVHEIQEMIDGQSPFGGEIY